MFRSKSIFVACAALLAAGAGACFAQNAQLSGRVLDPSGAAVVGARVELTQTDTNVVRAASTQESGFYVFPNVLPGRYVVTVGAPGFKQARSNAIVLDTGFSRAYDVTLELGAAAESIEVTAQAPLLETGTSSVGQLIERATVYSMPVDTRQAAQLVRLAGNVTYSGETGGPIAIPIFSVAGGRSRNQMWTLDGGVTQDVALSNAQLTLNPPMEALQEFKLESSNYAAEFGRSGNGFVQMTTRAGSNQFHGALYEFLRNDAFDVRTFFAPSLAPLRYNIFGASLGGRLIRDKTFFFANYEGSRQSTGVTVSNYIVPHPNEVRGDFSARRDVSVLDPLTRQPFPGNVIPASRLDPVGAEIARQYPAPNVASDPTVAPRNNFIANAKNVADRDNLTLRLDHNLSQSDRVYGRLIYFRGPTGATAAMPNPVIDPRVQNVDRDQWNWLGSWNRNLKANLINEVRYLYSVRSFIQHGGGFGSGFNGRVGLKGVDPDGFPRVNPTGYTALAFTPHERLQAPVRTQHFLDNVTWVKGNHTVKFGGEYRYSLNSEQSAQQGAGSFDFNDRGTRNGLASLLLGHVTGASYNALDRLNARMNYYGLYVQDDWRLTPRLTLNFGLRWDMDTPRWEADNRQSGFDGKVLNPVARVPGVVTFSGVDGADRYANRSDRNNLGPRFGFAFRVTDRTVVRGGYGISYNPLYEAVATALAAGFGRQGSFPSPDGGLTASFALRSGLPAIVEEPRTPAFGAVAVGASPRFSPGFTARDHVHGYAQQWNFTVQRQLRPSLLAEAAYIANVGRKLNGPDIDRNMIPLVNGRGPARQDQRLRPYPQFGAVSQFNPAWGNSAYHSMNLKLEKRYSNGLNFLANYTWAKFLDDVEAWNEFAGAPNNGYQHAELRRLDWSYSGNDIRHRLIASSVYELPAGKGKAWNIQQPVVRALLGDWSLSAIAEFRGGAPWGVIEQTNTSNAFSAGQRSNVLRDPVLSGDRTKDDKLLRWFDPTAFAAPGDGAFGNAARTLGFGPGFIGIDTSIHKNFPIKESWRAQFRADFFNLPNKANFGAPATARGRGDFGQVRTTVGTARQIQLSLRLEF